MFFKDKIDQKKAFKWGVGAGVAQLIYIALIVLLMVSMNSFFNEVEGGPLAMIAVLTLFVFSAAVSGLIVLGYPAYLFMQKEYKQAICTLIRTLLTIAVGFLIVLLVIFLS